MADVIPILDCIDDLVSCQSDDVAWLMRAGPVARRLNEESRNDSEVTESSGCVFFDLRVPCQREQCPVCSKPREDK